MRCRDLFRLRLLAAAWLLGTFSAGCSLSRDVDGVPPADLVRPDVNRDGGGGSEDAPVDAPAAPDGAALTDAADGAAGADADAGPGPEEPGDFADPVAVVASAAYVFVANAAFGADGTTPGAGFITVIDRAERRVVNRIPTSQPYPAALALQGDRLVVANRGLATLQGAAEVLTPTGPGSVDVLLDVATAATATGFDCTVPIEPAGLVGAPASVATDAGALAYVGSATTGAVFVVDVTGCALAEGDENPLVIESLTEPRALTVRVDADGLVWVAVRDGFVVFAYDPATGQEVEEFSFGTTAAPSGPADLVFRPGAQPPVLALLTLTDRIASLDPALNAGDPDWAVVTAGASALALDGDTLYVVETEAAALDRLDVTQSPRALQHDFARFPPGSRPTGISLAGDPGAREAWVALPGRDAVAVVDLEGGWTATVLGGAPLPTSCVAPGAAEPLPDASFASPEAAIAAGGFVVVASANLSPADGQPGQGFVTVIDPDSLAVVNRIPTSRPNPRFLAADDRWLYVVNTGRTATDADSGLLVPAEGDLGGGVDWIDLDTLATATAPTASLPIEPGSGEPPAGAPGALYLDPEDPAAAWVGSMVGPYLLELDRATCQLRRDTDTYVDLDPDVAAPRNDVAVPFAGPDGLVAVALATAGRVHLVDPANGNRDPGPAASPFDLGAAGRPVAGLRLDATPDLYVLLTDGATVATIDTKTGTIDATWVDTDPDPRRLRAWGDHLYVVNPVADAVQRVTTASGDSVLTYLSVPTDASPADLAVVALRSGETRGFVPNLVAHTVAVFDLKNGRTIRVLE